MGMYAIETAQFSSTIHNRGAYMLLLWVLTMPCQCMSYYTHMIQADTEWYTWYQNTSTPVPKIVNFNEKLQKPTL